MQYTLYGGQLHQRKTQKQQAIRMAAINKHKKPHQTRPEHKFPVREQHTIYLYLILNINTKNVL